MKSHEPQAIDCSDEELAERVAAGEVDLWPALARRILRMVRPIVRGEVRNNDDWEDVEQDCLLRFVRALPAYSARKGSLKVYVVVLARRQVIDYIRKRGRQPDLEDAEVLLDVAEEAAAETNPGRDLMAFIERVVGEERARAIRLRILEGHTHVEVAEALGKTTAAAKMLTRRALADLREHMESGDD